MKKTRVLFALILCCLLQNNTAFAFDKEPSSSGGRIESIIKLPEIVLDSTTMLYSGANIPYYQMASSVVYDENVLKKLVLPKPNKKYIYPVLLSETVMMYLNQLEASCDEMDRGTGSDKSKGIKKVAGLLINAEENVTNKDLAVIRGFDQIDYAFADMMYNINQLDANAKKEVVYELADMFHQANLRSKIKLSLGGSYDVGLLERHLGFYLAYYGAVFEEMAFTDTFYFHSASQMFVAQLDNSIVLDETVYSINEIYLSNEAERRRVEKMINTPNSSIFENDVFTVAQVQQMENELYRQAVNADDNIGFNGTEFKLENGICYEYRYKQEDGEKVLDKKWKLKEEEQYYCIGGLDGTVGTPGGLDSMAIHRVAQTTDYKSNLIDTTEAKQYIDKLGQSILVYEHKNMAVETDIPFEEDASFDLDDIRTMVFQFTVNNGYLMFDDGDKFVIFAGDSIYNFYPNNAPDVIEFDSLKEMAKGLMLFRSQEKAKIKYEDTHIENITDTKGIVYNTRTSYLSEPLLIKENRIYIPEKEFIKVLRVAYSNLRNGYFVRDQVNNISAAIDLETFTITTINDVYRIDNLVITENNKKYIDFVSINRLLGRTIGEKDGQIVVFSITEE